MKDRVKSFLAHKTEIAGKAIPTMIIVGLFLGGGSAALITAFSTSTTTMNVQNQALTITGDVTDTASVTAPPEISASSFTVANNNGNDTVMYNINATQETTTGSAGDTDDMNTTVFRVNDTTNSEESISVTQSYNTAQNRLTFNITDFDGDSGAIYFDRDGDDTPEFQAGFYDQGATTPRVTFWSNTMGTYERDTRYDADAQGEFDSDDILNSNLGTFDGKASGKIGTDYVLIRINASELGYNFGYGVKENGGDTSTMDYTAGANAAGDTVSYDEVAGDSKVSVTNSDTTGESSRLRIYGTQVQGAEKFGVINEFGSSTPAEDFKSTIKVTP